MIRVKYDEICHFLRISLGISLSNGSGPRCRRSQRAIWQHRTRPFWRYGTSWCLFRQSLMRGFEGFWLMVALSFLLEIACCTKDSLVNFVCIRPIVLCIVVFGKKSHQKTYVSGFCGREHRKNQAVNPLT